MANVRVWLWIAILTAILLFAARGAVDMVRRIHEYAYGCDSFGYLAQAKSIREAASHARLPNFHIDSPQTRLLIDHLKSRRVRDGGWDEVVAPHAHHYMRRSGHVGSQYPPGTGLALAVFPAGKAVSGLSQTGIGLLAITGALALVVAGARRAVASAGLVLLAIVQGFTLIVRYPFRSHSILAIVPPLLVAAAFAAFAASRLDGKPRLASIAAFGAGACLGFALLVRIPAALLIPGYALLLLPRRSLTGVPPREQRGGARRFRYAPLLSFVGALAVTGIAPLLLHQHRVAGAWYLTTYSEAAANPPTAIDASTFLYYLGGGAGSGERWILLPALAGLLAAVAFNRGNRRHGAVAVGGGLTWTRVLLAAAAIWLTSIVFFLTHRPAMPYYMAPGVFAAVCVLAFGTLAIEAKAYQARRDDGRRAASDLQLPSGDLRWHTPSIATVAAIALTLVPVATATARAARMERLARYPTVPPPRMELPAELADEHAWVWADELTGTFWYYARKPAFKIAFSSEQTRADIYRFVHERGESQFVVRDSPTMKTMLREIEAMGGVLEARGEVGRAPYFSVHWRSAPGEK